MESHVFVNTSTRVMMESSSSSIKMTSVKTSSTEFGVPYRSIITPRHLVISRSSCNPAGSNVSASRSSLVSSSFTYAPISAYSVVTTAGVADVKSSREREKKDMQDLNERFANYIEKVRFLEAQNRRLADELDKLKSKWGRETSQIKAMYQAELDEARHLLDAVVKEKARLEIRCASCEEQIDELANKVNDANKTVAESRETIDRQLQQLTGYEAELTSLRRRVEGRESERDRDRQKISMLQDALNNTRSDLDSETLLHIDAENRCQTLEEEIEFIKQIHEQEMKELAALAYRDTTTESREYWKNEMVQALREIQQVYDDKLDSLRSELDTYYSLKIQEFRTGAAKQSMETVHAKEESKRLRTQLSDLRDKLPELEARNNALQRELEALLREKESREREFDGENNQLKMDMVRLRAEMEAIIHELQNIIDTKLGLELEIAAYRKLLEGEENRIGLRQVVDSMYSGVTSSDVIKTTQLIKGELSAKTTYHKTAKGPVSIVECAADGKFISIENTGRKDEFLGGWQLKRSVDGQERCNYTIPQDLSLSAGDKIKFWAKGSKPGEAPSTDIETEEPTWGSGANIITKLTNPSGEDRASHVQKTVYI